MKWKVLSFFLCTVAVFSASSTLARNADVTVVRVPNGGIQPQAVMDGDRHVTFALLPGRPDAW